MGHKNSFLLFSVFMSLCFSLFARNDSDYESGDAWIVKNGQTNAEIVISEKAVPMTRLAAEQLREHLKDMSGAELEIVNQPSRSGKIKIFVGPSQWTRKKGIEVDDLKHDAYKVVAGKDWLALVGRDLPLLKQDDDAPSQRGELASELLKLAALHPINERKKREKLWEKWYALCGGKWGLNYKQLCKQYNKELGIWKWDERGSFQAVADFLRWLGMRWYMPGELGKCVPERKDIPLPKVDKVVKPDFPVRFVKMMFGYSKDEALWELWAGFNGPADMIDASFPSHGVLAVTDTRTKKGIYHHPAADDPKPDSYYAKYNGKPYRGKELKGKPRGPKGCLSSKGLRNDLVCYARKFFDIMESPAMSLMLADGYTKICECELCEGKDTPERGPDGVLSDYAWDMVNDVAREVYKTHPDKIILGASYGAYRRPPTTIEKFSPNVVAYITNHRCTFRQDPANKARFLGYREGLLKLSSRKKNALLFWEYYRGIYHTPHFNPHVIAEDLKSVKGIGMGDCIDLYRQKGKKAKVPTEQNMAVQHLDLYVTARLLWDADQNVDDLLDEYYETFYGPAAADIKALVEHGENTWMSMMKSKEDIDKTLRLIKSAMNKVDPETQYGKRVALLYAYLQPLELMSAQKAVERVNVPEIHALHGDHLSVKVDGVLDDPIWSNKNMRIYSRGDLLERKTGKKSKPFRTRVAVAYNKSHLYFGITARKLPGDLDFFKTVEKDSPSLLEKEHVEILLEPPGHSYYQICVNPAGIVTDLDKSLKGKDLFNWDSEIEVKTSVDENNATWRAEIKMPLKGKDQSFILPYEGVSGDRPTRTMPWYFNVSRHVPRENGELILEYSPSLTQDAECHLDKFARLSVGRYNFKKFTWDNALRRRVPRVKKKDKPKEKD